VLLRDRTAVIYGAAGVVGAEVARTFAGEGAVRVVCLRPDAIPESARRGSHVATVWARAAERAGMTLEVEP
jgi:NAD(P)-dependent dehydrogenase (short-subunit alcohol dehydrogenase family)